MKITRRSSAVIAAVTTAALVAALQRRHQRRLRRRRLQDPDRRLGRPGIRRGRREGVRGRQPRRQGQPHHRRRRPVPAADPHPAVLRHGTRRDDGLAGQRQRHDHLRRGQGRLPARPVRPAVGRKQPDAVKNVSQYDGKTYTGSSESTASARSTTSRLWTRPGSPRRPPGPSCWPSARPPRRRAPRRSRSASRTCGSPSSSCTRWSPPSSTAATADFDKKMQAGQATFANSPWTTAMAKYIEMNKAGCFQKNPLGTSYEASQTLAATGKTLGIIQGNWVVGPAQGQEPERHLHPEGAAGHRRPGDVHHARRRRRRLRGQRQGQEQGPGDQVRRLRDVAARA